MDKMDYKILKCLKLNVRSKVLVISKEIYLLVLVVIEWIYKMENNDVIKKYIIMVD